MRIPRSWRKFLILPLMPAVLLAFVGGCGGSSSTEPGDFDIHVTFQNLDTPVIGSPVHIFGPSESFPQGRLEPGESRVSGGIGTGANGSVEFKAGRAGIILNTKSCTCGSACESSKAPKVTWNGSSLSCVAW